MDIIKLQEWEKRKAELTEQRELLRQELSSSNDDEALRQVVGDFTPEQSKTIADAVALLMAVGAVTWTENCHKEAAYDASNDERSIGSSLELRLFAATENAPLALMFFGECSGAIPIVVVPESAAEVFTDALAEADDNK